MSCSCGENQRLPDLALTEVKPWLKWPSTLAAGLTDSNVQRLQHYLTCPAVSDAICLEVRARALPVLRESMPGGVILMKGGTEEQWSYYESDCLTDVFRQEPYFKYLFGVYAPDVYAALEVDTGKVHLYDSEYSDTQRIFCGPKSPQSTLKSVVDEFHLLDEMAGHLKSLRPTKLYVLRGVNSDSGIATKNTPDLVALGLADVDHDDSLLHETLSSLRSVKTTKELQYLQAASLVSSMAHCFTMKQVRPGMLEVQAEALFKSWCCYHGGARNVGYQCICASGDGASILHYGHSGRPNDRCLVDGAMFLCDMGGHMPFGYQSDITCTYPIGGKFSAKARGVYEAVLAAHDAVVKAARAGVEWVDMHVLAERRILEHLKAMGVVVGDVDGMIAARVGGIFMPHGLGHLIGLDVHDCGGFIGCERRQGLGIGKLRTTRRLEAGMFITIEPGCYFVDFLLDRALDDPGMNGFINQEVLEGFRKFGGVRVESDVIITESGVVNTAVVPRTVDEIEEFMCQ